MVLRVPAPFCYCVFWYGRAHRHFCNERPDALLTSWTATSGAFTVLVCCHNIHQQTPAPGYMSSHHAHICRISTWSNRQPTTDISITHCRYLLTAGNFVPPIAKRYVIHTHNRKDFFANISMRDSAPGQVKCSHIFLEQAGLFTFSNTSLRCEHSQREHYSSVSVDSRATKQEMTMAATFH